MMNEKYKKIPPAGLLNVQITATLVHESPHRAHYTYAYTIDIVPTSNDFINCFVQLLCKHGRKPMTTYAALLDVTPLQLHAILHGLTGASFDQWLDYHFLTLSEALLRNTNWTVNKIAVATGIHSASVFCRRFRQKHKCSPRVWR